MKRRARLLLWISGGLVAATTTQAVIDSANPYTRIIERNVFNLKAPAPPPDPESLKPPPPAIELQGISSILGKKKVLFKIKPAKPGEKEQSYILSEGQREGEVEVVAIDENEGSIKFKNHGTDQTLTMKDNASKAPTTTVQAKGNIPIPRPAPTGVVPRTGGNRPAPGGGVTSIGGGQQGLRQIPSRNVRTTPAGGTGAVVPPAQQVNNLSVEEQEVLIEAHKMKAEQEGDPTAVIFPPTSLTETLQNEAGTSTENKSQDITLPQ